MDKSKKDAKTPAKADVETIKIMNTAITDRDLDKITELLEKFYFSSKSINTFLHWALEHYRATAESLEIIKELL